MQNFECKRCGLLKSTIEATGKLCIGVSVNLPPHDFVIYCNNPDCDGDYEMIPNGHLHREDSKGFLKSVGQYIDPVAQVFMDFYSYLHQPNENGETELIIYQEWADKVRKVLGNVLIAGNNDELKDLGHVKEDFLK